MRHTELRQFLLESNREKLSPAEKDVFLYYQSRAQNGKEWTCLDTKVAEEIGRSRNTVCVARHALKERGWIRENSTFSIEVLRQFSVRNVTENNESESETGLVTDVKPVRNVTKGVRNETKPVRNVTVGVRNRTAYIDKNKKENFKENEEKGSSSPKATSPRSKGTRLPDQFLLTAEMRKYAAEKRPDIDPVLETEKFCNHFRSAPGQKGLKVDWRLTWNNWILRAYEFSNGSRNGSSKPFDPGRSSEPIDQVIAPPVPQPLPPRPAAKVPIEQTHAWNAFKDAIAAQINPDIFRTWFKPLIFDGIDAKRSVFLIRTRQIAHEWVTKYYGETLYEAFCTIGMPEFSIEWEIELEIYGEIESV